MKGDTMNKKCDYEECNEIFIIFQQLCQFRQFAMINFFMFRGIFILFTQRKHLLLRGSGIFAI